MWGSSVFVPRAKQEHGTMAFSPPLHQALLLQSLEEGLLLLVWVNNCLDQKEKEEGRLVSQFPLRVRPVYEGFGLRIGGFLSEAFFMKYVRIGEGEAKM